MAKIWKCPLQRRNQSRFSWPEATANLSIWPASWPAKFTILKSVIGMPNRKDNSTEYKLYYIDKCLRLGLHITTLQWNKKTASFVTKKINKACYLQVFLGLSLIVPMKANIFRYSATSWLATVCKDVPLSAHAVSASVASAESRFLFSETVSLLPLCRSDSPLEAWTTSTFLQGRLHHTNDGANAPWRKFCRNL